MRRNAVNRLLIFIAICDIATVCLYSVFVFQFGSPGTLTEPPAGFEFWWTVFLLVYSVFSVALHSVTVYCVVAAACLRYWSVRTLTNQWRHLNISRTVSTMCLAIAVLCIPAICLHSIERVSLPTETTSALYRINLSGVGPLQACSLFKINLWLSGFFFKILPCAMMLIVTVALLRTLKQSKRCRTVLLADTRRSSSAGLMIPKERTTKIIVVLLSAFLFTELPQGLLSVVNALFPHEIQWFVYLNFGELLDILSLINCNTCFVVYVATSPRYRMSLAKVIKRLLGQAQTSAASLRLQPSQFVMRKISYV
ncbi:Protein DMSR-6 [Aphelenchoides avenae]|nr:Protein DMSR-6 [Aphelenchus avenae]